MDSPQDLQDILRWLAADGIILWSDGEAIRYRALRGAIDGARLKLLRQHKDELIKLLEGENHGPTAPVVPLYPRPSIAPLSMRQRDFLAPRRPPPEPRNTHSAVRFNGPLCLATLTRSADLLVERHEALRTRFIDCSGQPLQVVDQDRKSHVEVHDLSIGDTESAEEACRQLMRDFAHATPRQDIGPLFRLCVVRLPAEQSVVAVVLDHILSDAGSIAIILAELWQAYFAYSRGQTPALRPVPLQFSDYAIWETRSLPSILAQYQPFWIDRLCDAPPLVLPTDKCRESSRGLFASTGDLELCNAEVTDALRRLAAQVHRTLPVFIVGGCVAVLQRWTGQADIVLRNTVSTRTTAALARTVGLLLNHVLLRIDAGGNPAFLELVGRVHSCMLECYERAAVPLGSVLSELSRPDGPRIAETFSINIVPRDMIEVQIAESTERMLSPYPVEDEDEDAFVEMMLGVVETKDRLIARLRYARDLFTPAIAAQLVSNLAALLEQIASDPHVLLDRIQWKDITPAVYWRYR